MMECKCVVAGSYEEAVEKLNKGEFYEPKPKADYEIRIKGDVITVENKNGEIWTDDLVDKDIVSYFEEAVAHFTYKQRRLEDEERLLLELMEKRGYTELYASKNSNNSVNLEFSSEDDDYQTAYLNRLYDVFQWLEDDEYYTIEELLENH